MANLHDFSLKTIDGVTKNLKDYDGKVLLVVNVASQCGYTPQYAGLEKLHATYGARGLAVLGIPANDFGAQEPGSDAEVKTFCTSRYDTHFDMFGKVAVTGAAMHPLYGFLQSDATNPKFAGPVKWNFTKFLIGKNGAVIGRFESKVEPTSPELIQAVEAALR